MNGSTFPVDLFQAIECLGDTMLVRPVPLPRMSAGGIIMASTAQEPHSRAVIEKIGPGVKADNLRTGDLVFFGKYAGKDMPLFGRPLLALREVEVELVIPAASFTLVEHPDNGEAHAHLNGEPCQACEDFRASLSL